ncbi:MAG TPA: hypothetical protein VJU86_07190 [Pyrinomonadaceae bacterium]|nr:hypothetical protein [Pyrinomonadaceae bacterium]
MKRLKVNGVLKLVVVMLALSGAVIPPNYYRRTAPQTVTQEMAARQSGTISDLRSEI